MHNSQSKCGKITCQVQKPFTRKRRRQIRRIGSNYWKRESDKQNNLNQDIQHILAIAVRQIIHACIRHENGIRSKEHLTSVPLFTKIL